MDSERDSVLQSHMGERNWQIARDEYPVQLIDRELGIGGLDNPPTVLFMAEPGPATLISLAPVSSGEYRLVMAFDEILDTDVLPNVEMPYVHFRPDSGVRDCLDGRLEHGGSHPQCFHLGDVSRRWDIFGNMVDIEVVHV